MTWCIFSLAVTLTVAYVDGRYSPPPDIGYPVGYIPECPGVTKNATITTSSLPLLQVVLHEWRNGEVYRKSMPVATANRMVAKEKHVDFKNKKTVLHAVGYIDSSIFPHSQALGTSYSKRGYNVFISETISFLINIYPKSARIARVIGKKLGQFLVKLTQQGLKAEDLELSGLSLGAHIVGFAAKHFYAVTGKKPSRITGLDPAGPCFRSLPPEMRLSASDAERVAVIHTNMDGFGIAEPLGHVDFYANGGEFQPGDFIWIPCLVVCSHVKSVLYWWQAVEHPKKFLAVKCDTVQDARLANCFKSNETNYFGIETQFDKPGVYYLPTMHRFPYYMGKEGLKPGNEDYNALLKTANSEDELTL
ncbi:lipoprotein lipase-like [Hyposmocoma kahamanoa]|uniref:lipoprotein lipase-like n=1 Tax=Hyposmocoma kahamanoa TaxID=1477025 RepID=UPI000E6D835F|nr:lipoprotein lipase-like [Hyposmocoma kahamanoa]